VLIVSPTLQLLGIFGAILISCIFLDEDDRCHWVSELDCGGAGKMAKHPWDEKEALNY